MDYQAVQELGKGREKMRAHSKSDSHIKHCEAELLAVEQGKRDLLLYSNYKLLESKRGWYQGTSSLYPFSCTAAHSSRY